MAVALGDPTAQRLGNPQRHRLHDIVLRVEVIVDRAWRHLRDRRDLLDGGTGDAARGEHLDRRGDQLATRAIALAEPPARLVRRIAQPGGQRWKIF